MLPLIYLSIAFLALLFFAYSAKDDEEVKQYKDNHVYLLITACFILASALAWPITITLSLIVWFLKK